MIGQIKAPNKQEVIVVVKGFAYLLGVTLARFDVECTDGLTKSNSAEFGVFCRCKVPVL